MNKAALQCKKGTPRGALLLEHAAVAACSSAGESG